MKKDQEIIEKKERKRTGVLPVRKKEKNKSEVGCGVAGCQFGLG
jgi:hypothetical protein